MGLSSIFIFIALVVISCTVNYYISRGSIQKALIVFKEIIIINDTYCFTTSQGLSVKYDIAHMKTPSTHSTRSDFVHGIANYVFTDLPVEFIDNSSDFLVKVQ